MESVHSHELVDALGGEGITSEDCVGVTVDVIQTKGDEEREKDVNIISCLDVSVMWLI